MEDATKYKVFDTLLDGVIIVNGEGKIRYCNGALSILLGIPVKRLKYDTILSSYVSFTPELYDEKKSEALPLITDSTSYREIKFLSKTGREGQVQISIQPAPSALAPGPERLWIIYTRDVTLEATLHSKYLTELDTKERVIVKLEDAQKKLKDYSETLEKKVEQRTKDLASSNQMLTAMINSLGQAFVVVDRDGICSKTYSKVTLKLLEIDPSLKPIATVLKIPPEQTPTFQNWLKLLLDEKLPFEELVNLGPKTFPHSNGRHISLEFHPIRESDKRLSGIVAVATDRTSEIQALRQAEQEQIHAKRVIKLAKYKDLFWIFVASATKTLTELRTLLQDPPAMLKNLEKILRSAHTLKGEAGLFWITSLAADIHEFETVMKELSKQPKSMWPEITSRAQLLVTRIEKNLQNFLVENVAIVGEQKNASQKYLDLPYEKLDLFRERLRFQEDLAQQFEDEFLKEPVSKFFKQYDDLALSIAQKSGKSVNPITIKGAETKILAEVYAEFLESFVHVITNAVDHGIENTEVRSQRNKPTAGTIAIEIAESNSGYHIAVTDDGGGIDPEKIREKLNLQGHTGHEKESDSEVIKHIFDAGFSTSQTITNVSGRGIGLNALHIAVKNLGGTIEIQSVPEKGTTFNIFLPSAKKLRAA